MSTSLAIWTPGVGEMVLILAALLLIFGARKLPELARSMGASINEFKRGLKDGGEDSRKKLPDPAEKQDGKGDGAEPGRGAKG